MDNVLTVFASGVMPILAIAFAIWAYRYNSKRWRLKVDAELQSALSDLGVDAYTLIVDTLTPPNAERSANVYRLLHDEHERYFLFMKVGGQPGVLKSLSKERALLAAKMNG